MLNLCTVNIGEYDDFLDTISEIYKNKSNKIYVIDDLDFKHKFLKKFGEKLEFFDFTEQSRLNHLINEFKSNKLDLADLNYYYSQISFYLDICDRYDYINAFSTKQRTTHFFHLLDYFNDFIIKNEINYVIFNHTPHHINTFCLYLVAKRKELKIKINTQFSFGNDIKFTLDDDIFTRCDFIKRNKNESLIKGFNKELIVNKFNYNKPEYIISKSGKWLKKLNLNYDSLLYLILSDFYNFFKLGFFKKAKYYLKINKKKFFFEEKKFRNYKSFFIRTSQRLKVLYLKKFYQNKCINFSYIKKEKNFCIFFPNYQPEATTSPSSGNLSNIFVVLEYIQSTVGPDCKIFYKEHPSTFNYSLESFFKRDKNFYISLTKRFQNLRFVDFNLKNANLIQYSKSCFCQTSNIAIEALRHRKPVIIFGNSWFDKFKNICKFESVVQAKEYLVKFTFNENSFYQELENYRISVEKFSYNLNFKRLQDKINLKNMLVK